MKKISLLILSTNILLSSMSSYAQKKQNTSTQNGRFQLIQLSDFRRDQYLLDTQTGKIWVGTCALATKNGECGYNTWTSQDVVGITISEKEYFNKIDQLEKFMKEKEERK